MTALDARPFTQVQTYHPRRDRQGVRRREALHRLWLRFGVDLGPTAEPSLVNTGDGVAPRPAHRPVSRYEQRAVEAGRTSVDLVLRRPAARR